MQDPQIASVEEAVADPELYLWAEVHRFKGAIHARLGEGGEPGEEGAADADLAELHARRALAERIVQSARAQAREGEPTDERPPLLQLAVRFGLSDLELDVLVATLSPHLDPEVPELLRRLRGGLWSEHLDGTVLQRLFAREWKDALALRRAIGPQSALMRNRLAQVQTLPSGSTALQSAIVVHPRIVHFAVGEQGLHHLIASFCEIEESRVPIHAVVLPDQLMHRALEVLEPHSSLSGRLGGWGYDEVLPHGRGTVMLFVGPPGTGKTLLSRALANDLGMPLLRVFVSKMMRSSSASEDVLEELAIEARLRHALLLFDDCADLFAEGGPSLAGLLSFLDRFDGIAILATNSTDNLGLALERRVLLRLDFPRPDIQARQRIFETLLPPGVPIRTDTDIKKLATTFDFTGGSIKNTVMVALNKAIARDPADPQLDFQLLNEAAEAQLRTRLDDFAVTSEAKMSLDDLVLPERIMGDVIALREACRNHDYVLNVWGFRDRVTTGRGIVAIFDGPPGTGKTFCAEILGAELARPVSRINLPSVVSKWVGETEKHIQEIFRRARAGRSILLFDEADSLFGKRVANVERATDRYANMEINLLLQEIERYEGIVILTTNLMSGIDDALLRRILFRITFEEPDPPLRAEIWRKLIPGRVPLADDVDFELVGHDFELTGGRIKNAVLRAAYTARSQGSEELTMKHLVDAGISESRAAGKVVREYSDD